GLKPFDPGRGPLLRVKLLRMDEADHILLVCMHHIVSDGWSLGIMVREFAALYEALANDRPSPLPELKLQYVDYAVWQRRWLRDEALEKQLSYWRTQLKDLPILEMPADHLRPPVMSCAGGKVRFHLDAQMAGHLRELARSENVTLFMVLLAAFQVLMVRYS